RLTKIQNEDTTQKPESASGEARGRGRLGQVGNPARAIALFAWTATAPQPLTLNVAVQKLCVRPRSFSFCRCIPSCPERRFPPPWSTRKWPANVINHDSRTSVPGDRDAYEEI